MVSNMNRQPAKVLELADVRRLLRHVQTTRHPQRNKVMALLSFHAGLRACEISGLTWTMVLAANGKVGDAVFVSGNIAKMGRARTIPMTATC